MKRCIGLVLVLLCACATTSEQSLYQALGGQSGVEQLVERVTDIAHNDERIGFLFEDIDFPYFKARLTEQICELSGGPCKYTGLDMTDAHSGMQITRAEFNYFVEDLQLAMDQVGLNVPTQNRLLGLLVPMHADIIEQ
ncbi:MAG: group 1 truncated hemoglobin [Lysobacteraceae bacterium]|nr:MAG: group 1 truncated hemoglobin [Xanthomonadaceae bacterium]